MWETVIAENATRPSLASFEGVQTGQEPAEFERPTDLDALSRKWSTNMGCGSGVGVLRGGGKVAVVGGRSGSFSPRGGYEGRRSAMRDSGLRSAQDNSFIPDGRYIGTSNRASRGDNCYKNRIRIRMWETVIGLKYNLENNSLGK
jgi:hypothetical protein